MADFPVPSSAIPAGFRFAATRAGIKASGRADLACIVAEAPLAAAAMFTSNQVFAAPVHIGRRNLKQSGGSVRAVVVNAGNANCATGAAGIAACERVCTAVADQLKCSPSDVFPSSTGIIGVLLPSDKIVDALPALEAGLGNTADHFQQFATAIMTTDTRVKVAHAAIAIGATTVRLVGATKGAGMIQPKLAGLSSPAAPHATMLAYLMTDAAIDRGMLQEFLHTAVDTSFNCISIDGDTSTNDTVLLLASGASGASLSTDAERLAFQQALDGLCQSLAKQMVADGEGVGHVVELNIAGASCDEDAVRIARSIANSPLVKTAWAGTDPNWGRILAAIGNAGVAIHPDTIDMSFGDLSICEAGGLSAHFDEGRAHTYLERPEFAIHVDLHLGSGRCRFWTCDLTSEYVKINADYST